MTMDEIIQNYKDFLKSAPRGNTLQVEDQDGRVATLYYSESVGGTSAGITLDYSGSDMVPLIWEETPVQYKIVGAKSIDGSSALNLLMGEGQ